MPTVAGLSAPVAVAAERTTTQSCSGNDDQKKGSATRWRVGMARACEVDALMAPA